MKDMLIIVESPSKAKTISKFLDGVDVIASKGHIRDLPAYYLAIKIEDSKYTPLYDISVGHKEIVKDIQALAKNKKVLLASDEDREGEAIGYHIATILGGNIEDYDRIAFHEITKSAILHAIAHPRKLDMNAVRAQEARRMLDRIVGYKLSPLLSNKVESKLTAGRVQSATLKLIYDREMSIRSFIPKTYYSVQGVFENNIPATLSQVGEEHIKDQSITDKELANNIVEESKRSKWTVESLTSQSKKYSPKPPFTTSTLQQAANSAFGFTPDRTMNIAQKLYEGVPTHNGQKGVITYMRTDSLNLAVEAVVAIRAQIDKEYGKRYLSEQPRSYVTKSKGAQEAHEAIRVTDVTFTPKEAEFYLDKDELKLYSLIYNRFMMCQMADNEVMNMNINFITKDNKKPIRFKATGRRVLFDGWTKLALNTKGDVILPELKENQDVTLTNVEAIEKQTEPPNRYNQASIVKAMEDAGIGRPSTYAATVSLLLKRGYVVNENKSLVITSTGEKVINFLDKYFNEITDTNFTSIMESKLDEIAMGNMEINKVLDDFCKPLMEKVKNGYKEIESIKVIEKTGEKCPKCGADLVKRKSKYGEMIGCSAYPTCKYVKRKESNSIELDTSCPSCGGKLMEREGRYGKFYSCSRYPKCKFISNYPISKELCPNCGNWQQEITTDGASRTRCLKCDPIKKFKKGKK